jgi:hypothetical protein
MHKRALVHSPLAVQEVVVVDMEITVKQLAVRHTEKMAHQTLAVVVAVFEINTAADQHIQELVMVVLV